MGRRKQVAIGTQPGPSATSSSSTSTSQSQAKFSEELQALADKAKNDTWPGHAKTQLILYANTAAVIGLLAICANASQLALSPVYGSIPASLWHHKLLMLGCFLGWAGNVALRQVVLSQLGINETRKLLPLVVLQFPMIQFFLEKLSGRLGPLVGPAVIEGATLLPLAVVSAASVADALEGVRMPSFLTNLLPSFITEASPGIGSWLFFQVARRLSSAWIQAAIGSSLACTRVGLQVILGATYAGIAPSMLLLATIPAILHTLTMNTHLGTSMAIASLNSTLLKENWTLLERRESITGYVSVLENLQDGYRVMRCDHSLLGGEWIQHDREGIIAEPIYGVFAMLEAVRLVRTDRIVVDRDAAALVIGLGVGTTPSALVSHGIATTVVEIDPVVYEFASKYFGLRENEAPVLEDATVFASLATDASKQGKRYEYIVHDVFTGGAEPVALFTFEFLEQLRTLLSPNGVIAINYAGDLSLRGPKTIVRTITEIFPSCRVFREYPIDLEAVERSGGTDFTNMVIFCKKTAGSLAFRDPIEADFLQSYARQEFLFPQHELDVAAFLAKPGRGEKGGEPGILRQNDTSAITDSHKTSAVGHWKIMRTVLPAAVWEQW